MDNVELVTFPAQNGRAHMNLIGIDNIIVVHIPNTQQNIIQIFATCGINLCLVHTMVFTFITHVQVCTQREFNCCKKYSVKCPCVVCVFY